MCTLQAEVENSNILPLFRLAGINKCALLGLFNALFFSFLSFFCLKWPPRVMLMCCEVVMCTRRLSYALSRKYKISSIQA